MELCSLRWSSVVPQSNHGRSVISRNRTKTAIAGNGGCVAGWLGYSMLQFWSIFSAITGLWVMFGIPAFVFYRRPKTGNRNLAIRFIVGVLGVWIGVALHRWFIDWPVTMALAQARGELEYDGVGQNVVVIFGGWIFGIVGSTASLILFLALRYVRQRQQRGRSGCFPE